ncbi:MAG: Hsp20/alpha crystallin family protein [Deltaproteobacteria bacterium]|nr:MAG: Hsp20/alpha crystallin family protein [Deltaproteobacteria bacterium]
MTRLSKWLPIRKKDNGAGLARTTPEVQHPIERLRVEMNRLFDELASDPFFGFGRALDLGGFAWGEALPRVDIKDRRKELEVSVEVPGMEPDDIDVRVEDDALVIRGEKRHEQTEEGEDYYLAERQWGSFQRVIPLPVEVEADKIKAKLKKGVLTLRIPKSEQAQQKAKKITVETED